MWQYSRPGPPWLLTSSFHDQFNRASLIVCLVTSSYRMWRAAQINLPDLPLHTFNFWSWLLGWLFSAAGIAGIFQGIFALFLVVVSCNTGGSLLLPLMVSLRPLLVIQHYTYLSFRIWMGHWLHLLQAEEEVWKSLWYLLWFGKITDLVCVLFTEGVAYIWCILWDVDPLTLLVLVLLIMFRSYTNTKTSRLSYEEVCYQNGHHCFSLSNISFDFTN